MNSSSDQLSSTASMAALEETSYLGYKDEECTVRQCANCSRYGWFRFIGLVESFR